MPCEMLPVPYVCCPKTLVKYVGKEEHLNSTEPKRKTTRKRQDTERKKKKNETKVIRSIIPEDIISP